MVQIFILQLKHRIITYFMFMVIGSENFAIGTRYPHVNTTCGRCHSVENRPLQFTLLLSISGGLYGQLWVLWQFSYAVLQCELTVTNIRSSNMEGMKRFGISPTDKIRRNNVGSSFEMIMSFLCSVNSSSSILIHIRLLAFQLWTKMTRLH